MNNIESLNRTAHKIFYSSANNMKYVESDSVHLVCTSPVYPMIELWDSIFSNQNSIINKFLISGKGMQAFEQMHLVLDQIWNEVNRILIPGGIVCINIGDAYRTLKKNFQLYPSHSRILNHFLSMGFQLLPEIVWHKQTNSPNKFMGSGMLPPGAYVTHEHEFILILRKGGKRVFNTNIEKEIRRESSYFWEERNIWFSDIWDIKGTTQKLNVENSRNRSAAFPFELAYRLINMFSVKGDLILDPFLGTGTTSVAAIASARNSVGYEIDLSFRELIRKKILTSIKFCNDTIDSRIQKHLEFIKKRENKDLPIKHKNQHYDFPVITNQENKLYFNKLIRIKEIRENEFLVDYS